MTFDLSWHCSVVGVRFYFTTTPNGIEARPSLLALVHVRLPPGFSPSLASNRPGNTVHQAFYRRGQLNQWELGGGGERERERERERDGPVQDYDFGVFFYVVGSLLLSASQSAEKDRLWLIDSDMFPFHMTLIESFVSFPL